MKESFSNSVWSRARRKNQMTFKAKTCLTYIGRKAQKENSNWMAAWLWSNRTISNPFQTISNVVKYNFQFVLALNENKESHIFSEKNLTLVIVTLFHIISFSIQENKVAISNKMHLEEINSRETKIINTDLSQRVSTYAFLERWTTAKI